MTKQSQAQQIDSMLTPHKRLSAGDLMTKLDSTGGTHV